MVFNRDPNRASPPFTYNEHTIKLSKSVIHLGHVLDSNKPSDALVNQLVNDLIVKFNSMHATFSNANYYLKYEMFTTFCTSFYMAIS